MLITASGLAALAMMSSHAGAQSRFRSITVDPLSPTAVWQGATDTFTNDTTLLHVDVDSSFWATRAGGVRIRIFDFSSKWTDFDLSVYECDADGNILIDDQREKKQVAFSGAVFEAMEDVAIGPASGYYLIDVRSPGYPSGYKGRVELVTRDFLHVSQRQPPGRQYSLPAVASGARPGPEVLYDATPFVPQLDVIRPPFAAPPLLVSGQEAYIDGEYLYQDYLYDDYGSDTNGDNGGICQQGAERGGDIDYPTDIQRYGGNAADLVEFRIHAGPSAVTYRITLNTLLEPDAAIVAVAFDTDRDSSTGGTTLPRNPGAPFPGTDEVITVWGTGGEYSRWTVGGWSTTPLSDADVQVDLVANQITAAVPRAFSDPRGVWRATVAVGLYDRDTGGWLLPDVAATPTRPGGASRDKPDPSGVFNLAFRFSERIKFCQTPPDVKQCQALRDNVPTRFAHDIDFAALDAGITRTTVPTSGLQFRILPSRQAYPRHDSSPPIHEGRDLSRFPEYLGQLQPYALYIPTTYAPGTPTGLTIYLHGWNQFYYVVCGYNFAPHVGELRDNLMAVPLARGSDSQSRDKSEYDIFEVWNDVAQQFTLARDSTILSGVSGGGYGTYRIGLLYPDLFGKAFTYVGPPGDPRWPPVPPTMDPFTRRGEQSADTSLGRRMLTNLWLENARNLPFVGYAEVGDPIVTFNCTRAQTLGAPEYGVRGLDQLGYRFYFWVVDPGGHGLQDDYRWALPHLGDGLVDRNPPHVTFAYVPEADHPAPFSAPSLRGELRHDHAYWVSGLRLAVDDINVRPSFVDNTGWAYPSKGVIDVKSHASGLDDPPSTLTGPTLCDLLLDPNCLFPTQVWQRIWGNAPPFPDGAQNRLDVKLNNLASVTVDAIRAGLDLGRAITIAVEANDSPCALTLAGHFPPVQVIGCAHQQTDQGVVLLLQPGEALVTITDLPVSTELALVSADVEPGRVRLTWFSGAEVTPEATVYRQSDGDGWQALGRVQAEGTGRLVYVDREVQSGGRYGYRLGYLEGGQEVLTSTVWMEVPAMFRLALQGTRPSPAVGDLAVAFSLRDARPASLELLDLAGRRLIVRAVEALGPGSHLLRVPGSGSLSAGIYWLRLTQGGQSLLAKAVLVR